MHKFILICAIFVTTICSQNINCSVIQNKIKVRQVSGPVSSDIPNEHKRYRRMVNGQQVKDPVNFPYQVGLLLTEPTFFGKTDVWCGGSIISHNAILTAAHCLLGMERVFIYFGDIDRKNPEPTARFLNVTSEHFIIHENYDDKLLYNDIALIKLSDSIQFGHNIKPIKLIDLKNADNIDNKVVTISGWGITNDYANSAYEFLETSKISILSKDDCQELLDTFKAELGPTDTSTMICANNKLTTGVCEGDSGGAAIAYIDDMPTQIGITSFIIQRPLISRCESVRARVFTRVSSYLNWICENSEVCYELN